jgi:hypothetical protein
MKISELLLVLATILFLPTISAEDPIAEGLILTTITSGTVVQTLVLQTQMITSCPCNGTTITATGLAVTSLPILSGSSDGSTMGRPGLCFGVLGFVAVLGGMAVFP